MSGKGLAPCLLQAHLGSFIRLIYQVIVLIQSKYLLSKAMGGYAF